MQWTTEPDCAWFCFGAVSVCFLFVYKISLEPLNLFAPNSQERRVWSLAAIAGRVWGQGQRSRSPGTKMTFFRPFYGGLRAVCLVKQILTSSFLLLSLFAQGYFCSSHCLHLHIQLLVCFCHCLKAGFKCFLIVLQIRNVEFTIMGLLQLTLTRSLYAIYNRCHICMRRHVVFNPPQ